MAQKFMQDVESLSTSVLVLYLVVVLNACAYNGVDGELALLDESRRSHDEVTSPVSDPVSL
jgi:hypothetical protein